MASIVFNDNTNSNFIPGYTRTVVSDITGQNIACTYRTNTSGLYLSNDAGSIFRKTNFPDITFNKNIFYVSSDGFKIYCFIVNAGPTYPNAIYYSLDGGLTVSNTIQSIYTLDFVNRKNNFVDQTGEIMIVANILYPGQGDGTIYTSKTGPGNLLYTGLPKTSNCKGVSYGSNGSFVACINEEASGDGGIYYSPTGSPGSFSKVFDTIITFTTMSGNSTGQYLCATNGTVIYYSNTFGSTWLQSTLPPGTPNLNRFISSSDGKYFYGNNTDGSEVVYYSTNYGQSWSLSNSPIRSSFLSCDFTGQYLMLVATDFYTSTNYGLDFVQNKRANNGTNSVSVSSGAHTFIIGTGTYIVFGDVIAPIVCFNTDTKILTNKGYRCIQDLRKGDSIKTLNDGYKNIEMIAKKETHHPALQNRVKDQLYKYSKNNLEEVFEDLIITGSHSVLVDDFSSQEEREKTREILGDIYITDNKYRLPACIDKKSEVLETPGTYTIYHFALENEDYYFNYGIYANGLLVETCSKRYLKELSNMELIE